MEKQVGKTYRAEGLDMNCFRVEVKVELVELLPAEKVRRVENYDGSETVFDCVIKSDGVRSLADSSKLY